MHTMYLFFKIKLKSMRCTTKLTIVISLLLLFWLWSEDYKDVQNNVPVILWWTNNFPGTEEIRSCPTNNQCIVSSSSKFNDQKVNAYLFYGSTINFNELPLPRDPYNVIWGLYHEESPRNVEELSHKETLNLFNFSSTFSRYSDVSFPLQYLDSIEDITSRKYFVSTDNKNNFNNIAPILYLQTDCETATERDLYVKELMKYIKIDSYGKCLKNKDMPDKFLKDYLNNLNDDDFLHFIARYKFVIAIENGICDDYITEKLWRAIKVGSVPIYFGSRTVKDWLPNKNSAILIEDYRTPKLMSEYIKKLDNNDKLYEKHLVHKTKQIISNTHLIRELEVRPYQIDALKVAEQFECFICEKLHEQNLGVVKQSVVNKLHYNCPEPISTLTLNVNPSNDWVTIWHQAAVKANEIKERILGYTN